MLVETGLPLQRLEWAPWAAGLGLSVDIGTTTVAAYLWDLDGRRQLGVMSLQKSAGAGWAPTWCPGWMHRWRGAAASCAGA